MAAGSAIGELAVANMPGFLKAIIETPKVQLRYMRQEMNRGVKRIRKNFIRTQLHGSPGIKAEGRLGKGKNIFTFVDGRSLVGLGAKIGISRILHVHEKGLTIYPSKSAFLTLHAAGGRKMPILGRATKVVIPARLKFRAQVAAESPAMLTKVADAGVRATEQTLSRGLLKGAKL